MWQREQHETGGARRAQEALWSDSQSSQRQQLRKTIRIRFGVRFRVTVILRAYKIAIKKNVTKTKKHRVSLG